MLTDQEIEDLATSATPAQCVISEQRDLREGRVFFFRSRDVTDPVAGSVGLIVNKRTGAVFFLGSAGFEQDIDDYEHGFQFDLYDLVVTKVQDLRATRTALQKIAPTVVEPEYSSGTVWRIARDLTMQELNDKLDSLPCVFPGVRLRGVGCRVLREVRAGGAFHFEALPYPRRELAPEWDRRMS